ncbi:MAG: AraC family transcriptional regulator [Eubacteriales bacterium]|nr:AraC family transcriptional regulator [Eubacteriales bacterium]
MKKSKVYLRLFLSYVALALGILCMTTLVYGYTVKVIQNQTDRLNENLLESVKKELDQEFENIQKVESRLAVDAGVQKLARVRGKFDAKYQLDLYYLYKDLYSITSSEALIDDVFICFNRSGKISSSQGNMSEQMYYDLYYKEGLHTFEQLQAYMRKPHFQESLFFERAAGGEAMFLTTSVVGSGLEEPTATVCIVINMERLKELLEKNCWNEGMDTIILDENSDIVGARGRTAEEYGLDYQKLTEGNHLKYMADSGQTMISVVDSNRMDWKYVTVTPASLIEQDVKHVRKIYLLCTAGSVVMGFAIAYIFAKRSYNPIRRIMDTFQQHGSEVMGEGDNEYQWLNRQVEQVLQKHGEAKQLLHSYQKQLKNYYMMKLVQEVYDGRNLEVYQIRLKLPYNMVLLLYPRPKEEGTGAGIPADSAGADIQKETALQRFVIQNIFEELCLNYFNLELVELGEKVAAVINLPDGSEQYQDLVKEQVEKLQQMTEETFGFTSIVLEGPVCEGLQGIHESYRQAVLLEEYVHLLDDTVIRYEDVRNIQPQYDYPADVEERIVNAIQVGDSRQAGIFMNEVFRKNLSGKVSVDIYRCLVYDMMGTLLKGASQGGCSDAAEYLELVNRAFMNASTAEVEKMLCQCMEQICAEILRLRSEAVQDDSLSREIERYIRENFRDPDLNIAITSQHFDKTPSYLSSIYKKQTGGSLLDFINTLRIDYAEELLLSGSSVVEAAEQSGFRDSGGFIRIFKKKKGITPGQMKKKV